MILCTFIGTASMVSRSAWQNSTESNSVPRRFCSLSARRTKGILNTVITILRVISKLTRLQSYPDRSCNLLMQLNQIIRRRQADEATQWVFKLKPVALRTNWLEKSQRSKKYWLQSLSGPLREKWTVKTWHSWSHFRSCRVSPNSWSRIATKRLTCCRTKWVISHLRGRNSRAI
jgi:hypothetical protein